MGEDDKKWSLGDAAAGKPRGDASPLLEPRPLVASATTVEADIDGRVIAERFRLLHRVESMWNDLFEAEELSSPRRFFVALVDERARDWNRAWREQSLSLQGEARVVAEVEGAIVFDRPRGERLDGLLQTMGRFDEGRALRTLVGICDALAARHALGRAHGEVAVHSGTVWIDDMSATLLPPVRRELAISEGAIDLVSTYLLHRCIAPEQTNPTAPRGPQTDVWALALVAFELLAGVSYWKTPVDSEHPAHFFRELLMDPLVAASERAREHGVAALPWWFDAWFARCVQRDPSQRLPTSMDAKAALLELTTLTPGSAPRVLMGNPKGSSYVREPPLSDFPVTPRDPTRDAPRDEGPVLMGNPKGSRYADSAKAKAPSRRWILWTLFFVVAVIVGVILNRWFRG